MGDLAFATSFNLLESGKLHFAVDLMKKGLPVQALFMPLTWGFILAKSLPMLSRDWVKMVTWCHEQISRRLKV